MNPKVFLRGKSPYSAAGGAAERSFISEISAKKDQRIQEPKGQKL